MFAWRDNYISYNGAGGAANDPYWTSVSLLLNYETPQVTFADTQVPTRNWLMSGTTLCRPNLRSPFSSGGASLYFPLSGYVYTTTAFTQAGTSSWTVECWFYPTIALGSNQDIFVINGGTGDDYGQIRISHTNTGALYLLCASGVSTWIYTNTTAAGTIALNAWYHIAAVRNGNVFTLYVNGVSALTFTSAASLYASFAGVSTIGAAASSLGARPVQGFISNFRYVLGTAVYTAAFTPPTTPLTAITNTQSLVPFLNQGQATTSATVYNDQSINAVTITSSGTPAWAGLSPFTNTYPGSIYFSGTGSTWLTAPANAAYAFGTGDFTVELWYYRTVTSGAAALAGNWSGTAASSAWLLTQGNSNTSALRWGSCDGTTVTFVESTACIVNNTWGHIAISRSSGVLKMFYNGTQVYSAANTVNMSPFTTALSIMAVATGSPNYLSTGNISNLRIVKGTAVYTAAFTPPTTPLSAITNTSLLLSGNTGSLYDLSNNGNRLTAAQSTQTAIFKYGTQGGLNTSGITTVTDATNLQFGTGDFTIEGWIYRNALGAIGGIISKGTSTTGWRVRVNASNQLVFAVTAADVKTSTTTIAATTWTYFAWTRTGSTNYMFINGTQEGATFTDSTNFNQTNNLLVGSDGVNTTLAGYMDDIRLTKAVCRYTASFTAPTSQFPTS